MLAAYLYFWNTDIFMTAVFFVTEISYDVQTQ